MDDLGILLPDALAQEVLKRLLYLENYPAACQAALDAQALVMSTRAQGQTSIAVANVDAADAKAWHWYEVALVGAGAIGAGFAIGYVVGATR